MSRHRPMLFRNAVIHTMDEGRPRADWMSILGGRVQRLGNGSFEGDATVVDLGGNTVVPGFIDAHTHFFQAGIDELFLDLSDAHSLADLGEFLKGVPGGPRTWIFAHSFEEDKIKDIDFVTRKELDSFVPDRPVWINRIDYHSAVVNSVALSRLGVPLGMAGMMEKDGVPTGILRSEAYFYAKARINRLYPVETKERAIKRVSDVFVRNGVTAVHALEGGRLFGDEGVSMVLKRTESIPLDVTLFLQEKNVFFTTRLGFEHLGGCLLIDGAIGSYTAALDRDYVGFPGQRGVLYEKPRELQSFVEEAHRAGVQLAFHAIGPRAIEMLLDAYERALERYPRYDHRHRIEHFELATDEQILRARDLGLVVSMQPAFEYFWGGPDGMYAARMGDGWRMSNRFRTILNAGLRIAGGSDASVTPPNPLLAMHAAVNHPNAEERIAPEEALRLVTIDAAYGAFNEKRHGSLSPGKDANFVVLDRDPLSSDTSTIKDIRVLGTWYRGRETYSPA